MTTVGTDECVLAASSVCCAIANSSNELPETVGFLSRPILLAIPLI